MAYTGATATSGGTTVEIGSGTAQDIADRIAALLPDRVKNEMEILGFTGGATCYIILKYRTTVANP